MMHSKNKKSTEWAWCTKSPFPQQRKPVLCKMKLLLVIAYFNGILPVQNLMWAKQASELKQSKCSIGFLYG